MTSSISTDILERRKAALEAAVRTVNAQMNVPASFPAPRLDEQIKQIMETAATYDRFLYQGLHGIEGRLPSPGDRGVARPSHWENT